MRAAGYKADCVCHLDIPEETIRPRETVGMGDKLVCMLLSALCSSGPAFFAAVQSWLCILKMTTLNLPWKGSCNRAQQGEPCQVCSMATAVAHMQGKGLYSAEGRSSTSLYIFWTLRVGK